VPAAELRNQSDQYISQLPTPNEFPLFYKIWKKYGGIETSSGCQKGYIDELPWEHMYSGKYKVAIQ